MVVSFSKLLQCLFECTFYIQAAVYLLFFALFCFTFFRGQIPSACERKHHPHPSEIVAHWHQMYTKLLNFPHTLVGYELKPIGRNAS